MAEGTDCTAAVVEYLRGLHTAFVECGTPVHIWADERWSRDTSGGATRKLVPAPNMASFAYDYGMGHPDEHRVLHDAVKADPDFGPIVGGMVGDETGLSRFTADNVAGHPIDLLIDEHGAQDFDADAIESKLTELRAFLAASERETTIIVPLPGVRSDNLPVPISNAIEIDALTDDEIDAAVQTAVLQPQPPTMPMLSEEQCIGARINAPVRAIVEPAGSVVDLSQYLNKEIATPRRFGEPSAHRFMQMADDILFVLRLARSEFVTSGGAVCIRQHFVGRGMSWHARSTRPSWITHYDLDESTVEAVRDIWAKMTALSGTTSDVPSIAVRRFNSAVDRAWLDDAIVDHLIAAEALFLKDTGSPEDRSELGYRLALRAAVFLEELGRPRRDTYKLMKRAYGVRSTIAHGGSVPEEIGLSGYRMPLSEFVDALTGTMRDSLRKALDELHTNTGFGTTDYWDDRIIGASS